MRSYSSRVCSESHMTAVLIGRGDETETQERLPCEDRGRDWNVTNQGSSRVSGNFQELGRAWTDSSSEPPARTSQTSGLQNWETINFCCYKTPGCRRLNTVHKDEYPESLCARGYCTDYIPTVTFKANFIPNHWSCHQEWSGRCLPSIHRLLGAVGDAEIQRVGVTCRVLGWWVVDWYLEQSVFLSSQCSFYYTINNPFIA